jgi:peptide/nickel transport system substrate-binding protein
MWRSAWRLLALSSLMACALPDARAASRPRYGGSLTVEIIESLTFTDPGDWPHQLIPLVYDGLVQFDQRGQLRPGLALSWQHDPDCKRWEFQLRPGVKFHDGSPLNAAAVAAGLAAHVIGSNVTASGDSAVVFQMELPAPDLPMRLADARHAILRRGRDGVTIGSGPFHIAEWQPRRRAKLAANDEYWGGRPFLDSIELQMDRPLRDQSIDLELGKADLAELTIDDARRAAQRGLKTWASAAGDLVAFVFERSSVAVEDVRLRQALALSIDRPAMHNVLLQKQGESTGALLPEWLTGYAFLFPVPRDLERARHLLAALGKPAARLSLAYDPADPLARPIAERIALNARDAGIMIQVLSGGKSDLRLARLPLKSLDPALALADSAAALGMAESFKSFTSTSPEALYYAEQKLLSDFRVVPLFHVPSILGVGPRVRNWDPQRWGDWRLENVWLEARTP